MSWAKSTLSKLAFFQRGFDITKKEQEHGIYPVVSSSGIQGYHSNAKARAPGVVIGRKGTLGLVHYIESDFWPHDTTLWVKDFQGNNPKFVYYFIKTLELERFDSGGANPTLNRNHIHGLEVLIPPREIQDRIANILSNYDRLIDNNSRRIALLEESIHLLYQEWFVRSRFPGYEEVEVIDGVPKGWKTLTLNDVVLEIIDYRGKTPKKLGGDWSSSGIIALSALNLKRGRLVSLDKCKFVNEDLYSKWMKSELKQGDILMTSEAPLGELYYLAEDKKYCLSQRLFSIRVNPEIINPVILFCALNSSQVQGEIHARQSGTTVLGIRQSDLRKVPIIVPPIEIQAQASEILDKLFMQKEKLQKMINNLQEARDRLLPRLMNGSIAV